MNWRKMGLVGVLAMAVLASGGCCPRCCRPGSRETGWQAKVVKELPIFGHRNWIVIADSAYPAQSNPGIETIATGQGQLATVAAVLDAVEKAEHVTPVVYLDAELEHVSADDAPGIDTYRQALHPLLAKHTVKKLPHDDIIAKLDEAGKRFRILILKTDLTLPYTSVFLELGCGYWSEDAEKRLRETMGKAK